MQSYSMYHFVYLPSFATMFLRFIHVILSMVCFFLMQSSISLYKYTIIGLSTLLLMGNLTVSSFEANMNKAAMTILVLDLYNHTF